MKISGLVLRREQALVLKHLTNTCLISETISSKFASARKCSPDECCPEKWPEKYEAFTNLARLSIGFYKKDNRKLFQRFEVEKVLKVNTSVGSPYDKYFLTFTAVNIGKRGCCGDPVIFQTLVFVWGSIMFSKDGENIIEFCRLKPDVESCNNVLKESSSS